MPRLGGDERTRTPVRAFAVPAIASAGVRRRLCHGQTSPCERANDRGCSRLLLPRDATWQSRTGQGSLWQWAERVGLSVVVSAGVMGACDAEQ